MLAVYTEPGPDVAIDRVLRMFVVDVTQMADVA